MGAAEGEALPKVYPQSPQQQWVLGEEEEANGYADEQRLKKFSEMHCIKEGDGERICKGTGLRRLAAKGSA